MVADSCIMHCESNPFKIYEVWNFGITIDLAVKTLPIRLYVRNFEGVYTSQNILILRII